MPARALRMLIRGEDRVTTDLTLALNLTGGLKVTVFKESSQGVVRKCSEGLENGF